MAKLLIVDDEKHIRKNLSAFFESFGHRVLDAESARRALELLANEGRFDLVLSDYRMADGDGLELLQLIKRDQPQLPVILMTAYGTVENALTAMKSGAYDFVSKPFSLGQIQYAVTRALELESDRSQAHPLRHQVDEQPLFQSRSPLMEQLHEIAGQAAASEAPVLLIGERGTGKHVLAREIHRRSRHADGPFVVVNCAIWPTDLFAGESCGDLGGPFNKILEAGPEVLQAANGGTMFFDEIADLSAPQQARLLGFVQEQRLARAGGGTIQVDCRIIAASSRDLMMEVQEHRFRADLFYRLNVIAFQVPALRHRREDILALTAHFLSTVATCNHRRRLRLSVAACAALERYPWPGNIRELRNALERASILAVDEEIGPDCLPDALFREQPEPSPDASSSLGSLEEVERQHIERILAGAPTLEEAAAILGIDTSTLWRKRKRYKFQ